MCNVNTYECNYKSKFDTSLKWVNCHEIDMVTEQIYGTYII